MPIPHLNMMEWQPFMSGHTTGVTPEVWAKAILTMMSARRLLAIWAQGLWGQGFMSQQFYKNSMSATQILFEELVLRLKNLVRLQWISIKGCTHLSNGSGPLGHLVYFRIIIVELRYSRRPRSLLRRRCTARGCWWWFQILDRNVCDPFPPSGLCSSDFQ